MSSSADFVPYGLDYEVVAPFISLTLSTLYLLGTEDVVKQYARAEPEASHAIQLLCKAVAAAGVRVRDSGKVRDQYDVRANRMFTAEEFWQFDLAIDVIAMLVGQGGLSPSSHALVLSDLRSLDEHVRTHHWKSQVRKAGEGPVEFHYLRAHVPHHNPHW